MIILASQSPRRAELLRQVGVPFRSVAAEVDERVLPGETPAGYVERLAVAKARAVDGAGHPGPVLGSDTAVVRDAAILGKPADANGAIAMLLSLSGRQHEVLTGVALLDRERVRCVVNRSRVWFRVITRDEALAYWDSGEPVDKAGGYAIQGLGAAFVARIDGSYSGIMGLPLFETLQLLGEAGVATRLGV